MKKRLVLGMMVALMLTFSVQRDGRAQLNEEWTVSVAGQTIPVNADGSFYVSNISSPDNFGDGGPGTPPDGSGDDFIRVLATRVVDGRTEYAFSEPFQINQGKAIEVGELTLADIPPPLPIRLRISAERREIALGESTEMTVIANARDGRVVDVTRRARWTTYRSSNPSVATVGANGLVEGRGLGTAFITAVNDGVAAVARIDVVSEFVATTVEGFAIAEDGRSVNGALVTTTLGGESTSGPDGFFRVELSVPIGASLEAFAEVEVAGRRFVGRSGDLETVAGGITDAGLLTLTEVTLGSLNTLVVGENFGAERAALVADLEALGHRLDTAALVPAELGEYDVVWYVDLSSPLTEAERVALVTFVESGGGLHLTGERQCCEDDNDAIEAVVEALVLEPGQRLGDLGDQAPSYEFNSSAAGSIAQEPNVLGFWLADGVGGISGLGVLPDPNILATGFSPGTGEIAPIGGVWDCSDLFAGRGRLTVLMDGNWLARPERAGVIENIQTFLGAARSCR